MSLQILESELDNFEVTQTLSLKQRLQSVLEATQNMHVVDQESFNRLTTIYAESKDWEKRIEFLRKEANAPDQDRINARNDKAKEVVLPLKQIQALAKQKCEHYQLLLDAQKREAEAQIQKALDLVGLTQVALPNQEKSTRGEGAMMYTRTVRKFRTVDLSKVPLKYLQLNEELIERDIKLGIGEIAGLEIYEETITQLRTR